MSQISHLQNCIKYALTTYKDHIASSLILALRPACMLQQDTKQTAAQQQLQKSGKPYLSEYCDRKSTTSAADS